MTRTTTITRAEVVHLARQWIGTPYHHQASERAAGVDCIGLVRGVWRAIYGREPETLPGYSRDWAEATGRETLLEAARRHFVEIDAHAARPGDVLVFRYRPRSLAKHAGIVASSQFENARMPPAASATLIHAVEGAPVTEVPLSDWWQRRIAAAFSFPGIID
jgi:NlpC/P60 family putative phage cell wall peptidase